MWNPVWICLHKPLHTLLVLPCTLQPPPRGLCSISMIGPCVIQGVRGGVLGWRSVRCFVKRHTFLSDWLKRFCWDTWLPAMSLWRCSGIAGSYVSQHSPIIHLLPNQHRNRYLFYTSNSTTNPRTLEQSSAYSSDPLAWCLMAVEGGGQQSKAGQQCWHGVGNISMTTQRQQLDSWNLAK